MTAAARAAPVTLRTLKRRRLSDPEFKKAEADALEMVMETPEPEAIQCAIEGVELYPRVGPNLPTDGKNSYFCEALAFSVAARTESK